MVFGMGLSVKTLMIGTSIAASKKSSRISSKRRSRTGPGGWVFRIGANNSIKYTSARCSQRVGRHTASKPNGRGRLMVDAVPNELSSRNLREKRKTTRTYNWRLTTDGLIILSSEFELTKTPRSISHWCCRTRKSLKCLTFHATLW